MKPGSMNCYGNTDIQDHHQKQRQNVHHQHVAGREVDQFVGRVHPQDRGLRGALFVIVTIFKESANVVNQ